MKFGTFCLFQNPHGDAAAVYRNELAQMVAADRLGYDTVWLAEHHFSPYGIVPAPLLFASHVAALTERVRIGLAVSVLPFADPVRIAEDAAMVDVLSNGRLEFGVGRGYQRKEFDGFGVPMSESRERFDEGLDIILGAWTRSDFSYEGKYRRVEQLDILPKPLQQPHPPVWIAAWQSPETIRWAARRGYPIMSPQQARVGQLKRNFALYREEAQAAGHDPSRVEFPILAYIYCHEDSATAREDPWPAFQWYCRALSDLGTPMKDGQLEKGYESYGYWGKIRDADYRAWDDNVLIFGTPDECIAKLKWLEAEIGLNYVITWQNFGGLAHEKTLRSLKLFAEEVMPAFREPARVVEAAG